MVLQRDKPCGDGLQDGTELNYTSKMAAHPVERTENVVLRRLIAKLLTCNTFKPKYGPISRASRGICSHRCCSGNVKP